MRLKIFHFSLKDLKSVIKQTSKGELQVEISKINLNLSQKEIKDFIKPIIF